MTEDRAEQAGNANNFLILDLPAALEAIDGKEELLKKITGIFYNDMPHQLEIFRQALTDEDIKLITRQAHTIKGASDNIKANLLADAALQVEKAAINGRPQEAFGLFKKLEIELEKVRKTLLKSGFLDKNSMSEGKI
jgi:HPt (histidine-containing phosphotransfer) domain-containing protein